MSVLNRRSFIKFAVASAGGAIALAHAAPAAAEIVSAEPTWTRMVGFDWADPTSHEVLIVQNVIYRESVISRLLPIQQRYNEVYNLMLEHSYSWSSLPSIPQT